jgi:LemA protein
MTAVYIILAILLLVGVAMYLLYTQLIASRIECQEAWNQLTARLKLRYDVLPNIVDLMRSSAAHETALLEQVEQARNSAILAKGIDARQEAEDNLTYQTRRLMSTARKYPAIANSTDFTRLSEELRTAENQIAFAIQEYNETVDAHNRKLQKMPYTPVSRLMKFHPMQSFHINDPSQHTGAI